MGRAKTNPQFIETAERRNFVLTLRKSGATYRQITKAALTKFGEGRLPVSWGPRYAHKDISRELKRLNKQCQQDVAEIKRMELERLDVALRAIWGQVQKGHLGAIDRFLRLSKRRARLCGLDAPKDIDLTSGGEKLKWEIVIGGEDNAEGK